METLYLQSILIELKQHSLLGSALLGVEIPSSDIFSEALFERAGILASGGLKKEEDLLQSIFSTVTINGQKAPEIVYFKKEPMSFSKDFFPSKQYDNNQFILDGFRREFALIDQSDIKNYAETLLFLVQKYGVGLPSPAGPDVSFYDYLKVKIGLSICLHQSQGSVLLIGGGVSGIQNYLYDIIRRKAAINLKGRSFYLQLLIDEVAQYVLEELGLFQANILYASGGNFYLIAPGNLRQKVRALERQITKRLFDKYKTGIRLELAAIEMNDEGMIDKSGKYWAEMGNEIGKRKFQPFNYLLDSEVILEDGQNGFEYFFTPQEIGGETPRDAITNEEISDINSATPLEPGSPTENLVLPSTLQQKELGQGLRKADFVTISQQEGKGSVDPAELGYFYRVSEKRNDTANGSTTQTYAVNNLDFIYPNIIGLQGFRLFGGSEAPVFLEDDLSGENEYRKGEMKTFEHLAMGVDGFVRLGFLRMDVDNLGKSLGEVSREADSSLARISTFSRCLDYYFKGYLNYLWKNDPMFSQYSQIIYAGGDDLFIVGRWDVMIDLAARIRGDFEEWTAHHPGISLSGGLTFVTPKFPVSKAAAMAGEEEDIAKDYEVIVGVEGYKKNAFTLLGQALHWELDMPIVKSLKEQLVKYISSKEIPKSVLMNIQRFHQKKVFQTGEKKQGCRDNKGEDEIPVSNYKTATWRWQTAYTLARAADRLNGRDSGAKEFLASMGRSIFANSVNGKGKLKSKHEYFDLLNVAARWAELELRTVNNKT